MAAVREVRFAVPCLGAINPGEVMDEAPFLKKKPLDGQYKEWFGRCEGVQGWP